MKNTHVLFLGLATSLVLGSVALGGCSSSTTGGTGGGGGTASSSASSSSTTTSSTSSGSSSSGGTMFPAAPKLGAQLDRIGRPAINTALNHTFDVDPAKGMAKDAYNVDTKVATWGASYAPEFAKNLGILDSLDTICGNQVAAAKVLDKTRYAVLSGALADDRLWLKTDTATCTTYLAVEAAALGQANTDCGGRKLDYDVIDASYTALSGAAGVGDGVPPDADTAGKTFPYLAAPH